MSREISGIYKIACRIFTREGLSKEEISLLAMKFIAGQTGLTLSEVNDIIEGE